jgi:hypothetical protein
MSEAKFRKLVRDMLLEERIQAFILLMGGEYPPKGGCAVPSYRIRSSYRC